MVKEILFEQLLFIIIMNIVFTTQYKTSEPNIPTPRVISRSTSEMREILWVRIIQNARITFCRTKA